MRKNLLVSLLAYIIIVVAIWIVAIILYQVISIFVIFFIPFMVILPYLFVNRFLTDQGRWYKNLLSVSSTTFVLILIWFICYLFEPANNPLIGIYDQNMIVVYILNPMSKGLSVVFCEIVQADEGSKTLADILMILFNTIPSIFIWLGLEFKSIREKNRISKVLNKNDSAT